MVMVVVTDFVNVFGRVAEVADHSRYDVEFSALQADILQRVEDMTYAEDADPAIRHAVVTTATALLTNLANEAESPCVRAIGKDIDPWDERIGHLRETAEMTADVVLESFIQETGFACDDPRLERVRPIAAEIADLVSRILEEAIETVKPVKAPPSFRPTI